MIIWVGRFSRYEKRPDRMIAIWKRINAQFPDWRLVMIGDGPERSKIEKKASRLDRVSFTGYCDPLPYYQKASILCMTSNFEGWGMVLTESMSQGCVPLSFESFASVYEIIDNRRQLIKPYSIRDYVHKLSELMSDQVLLHSLRESGYINAAKFTGKCVASRWIDLINDQINELKK